MTACAHLEEELPGSIVRGRLSGAPGWQAQRRQVAERAQLAPVEQHHLLRALGQAPCMVASHPQMSKVGLPENCHRVQHCHVTLLPDTQVENQAAQHSYSLSRTSS